MTGYCSKAVGVVAGIIMLVAIQEKVCAQGYSLQALTDSAAHHLPAILQKQALVNSAQANITDVRHAALPSLKLQDQVILSTANGAAGTYFPGAISTSGAIRNANIYQPATGNIGMVYGEYELLNFGLNKARVANATVNRDLRSSDLSREIYLTRLQVGKLYFTMLRNLYQLGVDQQNISRYEAIYNVIQAITKSGIRAGVDSSLAGAELSRSQISYNQRVGEIRQLQQQLSFLTGIDSISIDTSEQRYAHLMKKDSLTMDLSGKQYSLQADTAWGSLADTINNPLVDYYRHQREVYTATANLIKKSYLPKVLLAGGFWARGSSVDYDNDYNYKALSTGLGYQRVNYGVGLTVVYNLFDGVHRKDKLSVNRYNIQASDYGLQQQQQALKTALLQAQTAIDVDEQNLHQLPVQLQAAEDAYSQKMAQYRAGIINLVDLTNSSFVLYRAQTDYVETLNDWLQANLDKAAATGNLDQFIQSVKN
ncbi:TolC family protein [Chitinophaga agrisoli]|uniref:TolC family protein n=1 Tax=Chitinophaga agrisoli TaxID=2607653 RepID=A0A5B2VK40_9BACT|nr:TolC family protein [Chitinophaga agrisoli]KAA2238609.1 TolC family protein [Chitinophaga agrisoli]